MTRQYFISYRRSDVKYAARSLQTLLQTEFPDDDIFLDVIDLASPGEDFVDVIHRAVPECAAIIVMVGADWNESFSGRPEGEPDYVAEELDLALKHDVPIFVVTMDGAAPPRASDLPPRLRSIARLSATDMRYASIERDAEPLLDALHALAGTNRTTQEARARKTWAIPAALVALVLAAGGVYAALNWEDLTNPTVDLTGTTTINLPAGPFLLSTQLRGTENECLESNQQGNGASNMRACLRQKGQQWMTKPLSDGYYLLTSKFRMMQNECLDSNVTLGGSFAEMGPCSAHDGSQNWKAVPVEGGAYFYLTTAEGEGRDECLTRSDAIDTGVQMTRCVGGPDQSWKMSGL